MEPNAKALPTNPPSIHKNVFRAEVENVQQDRTETATNMPPGYGRNVHTIDDYRRPSRSCWPGLNPNSFNPFSAGGDKAVLCRRICMITILAIRTLSSVLSILRINWVRSMAEGIIDIILSVLAFFFVAWCLAMIGNMKGERRVFGKTIGRWHFDVFLAAMFVAHVGLLIGVLLRMPGAGSAVLWIGLWLLMFGAAWIATWPDDDGVMV